ncbi:MAG: cache domain-containing protein [Syntrophales bacterium]|nr:cache domain-containing protein [Syntrophales bacterium]
MKKAVFSIFTLTIIFSLILSFPLQAEEKMATPEQAKGLLSQMVELAKKEGCDKAAEEIKSGKFNLYKNAFISISDGTGVTLYHSKYPFLAGQNHIDLKDATGKYFIRESMEQTKKTGKSVVHYQWMDPKTKKVEPRTMMVEVVKCSDGKNLRYAVTYEGKI